MTLILLAAGCLLLGVVIGITVTIRVTPWIVARLPRDEQLAFARKINRHRRAEGSSA